MLFLIRTWQWLDGGIKCKLLLKIESLKLLKSAKHAESETREKKFCEFVCLQSLLCKFQNALYSFPFRVIFTSEMYWKTRIRGEKNLLSVQSKLTECEFLMRNELPFSEKCFVDSVNGREKYGNLKCNW
jgi:hypothetical protein